MAGGAVEGGADLGTRADSSQAQVSAADAPHHVRVETQLAESMRQQLKGKDKEVKRMSASMDWLKTSFIAELGRQAALQQQQVDRIRAGEELCYGPQGELRLYCEDSWQSCL